MKLNPSKTGLALGSMTAIGHLFWSLLVASGFAQECMNWILSLHFLDNPYTIMPFDLITSLTLIVVTGIAGFIVGYVFSLVWNYWQKKD